MAVYLIKSRHFDTLMHGQIVTVGDLCAANHLQAKVHPKGILETAEIGTHWPDLEL
jgi:hypothetical protein